VDFTWQDGERTIRFGRGAIADAPALLGDGYVLLSTQRALAGAPQLAERAAAAHEVPGGPVDELAADLAPRVDSGLLVAFGGGRVIDTAKAVAAVNGARVAAIPTTLSAAEMTRVHRQAKGAPPGTGGVRPAIVLNDPDLSASQPPAALAASAANSLAHAIEGSLTTRASPVPQLAAQRAVALIAQAYGPAHGDGADPDGTLLALAALLSGYTIDATGYGLHHVLAQTLVRVGNVGHGPANAVLLPHTIAALRERSPQGVDILERALGGALQDLAARLAALAGAARLRDMAVEDEVLDRCAETAAGRAELDLTPPRAAQEELRALYAAAW
jgi:alcohol dehydrogenase class IV